MKIRNRKTGEIVEITDLKQLAKYGLKVPKAINGLEMFYNTYPKNNAEDTGEPASMGLAGLNQMGMNSLGENPITPSLGKVPELQLPGTPGKKKLGTPNYFGMPYNVAMSAYSADSAQQRQKDLNAMERPDAMTDSAWQDYTRPERTGIAGDKMAAAGYGMLAGFNAAKVGLGAIGAEKQWRLGRMNERESANLQNRERAEITTPYNLYGDDSQLGGGRMDPLSLKYGGELPMAMNGEGLQGTIEGPSHKNGGVPMDFTQGAHEIDHLKSSRADAQIEAQGGEVAIKAKGGGYIFSKEKDMASTKREHLEGLAMLEDGGAALALFSEKFSKLKDDDMITPAMASKVFNTDKEIKLEKKLGKKLKINEEIASSNVNTSIAKKTAELTNRLSLNPQLAEVRTAIELKNNASLEVIAPLNDHKRALHGKDTSKAMYGKKLPMVDEGWKESDIRDIDQYLFMDGSFQNIGTDTDPRYLRTGANFLDPAVIEEMYPQYKEVGAQDPQLQESLRRGMKLGRLSPNQTTSGSIVAGQKKNKDGTYGSSSLRSMRELQEEFPALRGIARHFGKEEFDPTNPKMMEAFEKSYNNDYREETGKDFFLAGSSKHAFDKDLKSGNWHLSIPKINRKSIGPVKNPVVNWNTDERYNKETGLWDFANYVGEDDPNPKPVAPVAPVGDKAGEVPTVNVKGSKARKLYHEGLNPIQTIGEMATLFDRYEPAPYIEDQGAKDAYAMGTKPRYLDIQPQLNRTTRDLRARTRYNPTNASMNAQLAANAYEANNQVYGQKYNADSQIDANFMQNQQNLRMRAGTNKAQALNTLAERTAKGHSAFSNRAINAMSLIGNKYAQQRAEDRASALYQDMFPNFGWDGYNGSTFQGTGYVPSVGGISTYGTSKKGADAQKMQIALMKAQIDAYEAANPEPKKYGGKLPKKMVKKLK